MELVQGARGKVIGVCAMMAEKPITLQENDRRLIWDEGSQEIQRYAVAPAYAVANFFLTYPQLVSKAMQNFVRVNGTPKADKEKLTLKSFVSARSWIGLLGDAFRFARAWRGAAPCDDEICKPANRRST